MTLALVVIFTIINLRIYHKIFHVVYFDLGQGLFREIFYSALIALFEAGIVIKFFSGVIGVIGKILLLLLKVLLILAVIAIIAGIIWKIIQVVQGKCQTAHCGRRKLHFDFGASASPTAQSCG